MNVKKWIILSLFVALLLVVSACSKDEKTNTASDQSDKTVTEEKTDTSDDSATTDETESDEPADPAVATSGEEVFKTSCITCHSSGDITGGPNKLDAARIKNDFKAKTDLQTFVSSKMPKSAPGTLSADEYESVVNYLWEQQN
jgi:cytochrome c5